ncbi:hypothetical protein ACGFJC_47595 [Nonomuraea fuscirosea]|uniref:hypothetical protein n=1 Tax=Nonomuraea fuscirosea TaxID=1291556 RepID=UPI0037140232
MRHLAALHVPQLAADPASPPAGHVAVYAGTDGQIRSKTPAGAVTVVPAGPRALPPYTITGPLQTVTGTYRLFNDTGRSWTIVAVRATVVTAPAGSGLTVDVHKNGTTVFTNQANRPIIAAGTTTIKRTTIDVPTVADGDYLTVDVDAVGSTTPGSDLTVQITVV